MGAKETVKENLIRLRREHKLTQLELSDKINYSDKAISRWETGEVTPDIETLEQLAMLYGIPITAFFLPAGAQLSKKERKTAKKAEKLQKKEKRLQEKEKKQQEKEERKTASAEKPPKKPKDPTRPRRIAFLIFSLCFLWTVALSLFSILNTVGLTRVWMAFIWGVPATFTILSAYFGIRRHAVTFRVMLSLLVWTALTATYLQIAFWKLFPLLFLGIPLQTVILLLPFLKKKN